MTRPVFFAFPREDLPFTALCWEERALFSYVQNQRSLSACCAGHSCAGTCRWDFHRQMGRLFARGSFGEYTDGIFAMQIPVSAVRAADVTEMMRNHVVQIEETNFVQVHPTFLYESVWCLLLAVCIFLASKKRQQDGELFLIFLLGYGLGRFWIEGFRTDSLLIPGVESPVSQVISVFLSCFLPCILYTSVQDRMDTSSRGEAGCLAGRKTDFWQIDIISVWCMKKGTKYQGPTLDF